MSWMIALPGTFGSRSPQARAALCSYAMAPAGTPAASSSGCTSSITMRMTRAFAASHRPSPSTPTRHAMRMALMRFSLGTNGDEDSMRGAGLRLGGHAEAGLGEEPAPVLRRVLVVDGEEPESAALALGRALPHDFAPPREIRGEGLAYPVIEQNEAGGCEDALYLSQHGQRLVEHVQHRRHAEQIHAAGGVGKRLGHVAGSEAWRNARVVELLAIADHGRGDVVSMQVRLREPRAQIAQQQ